MIPASTAFFFGIVTGAFLVAAAVAGYFWLLCRQAQPMDKDVA
jgi:hypothetical protein